MIDSKQIEREAINLITSEKADWQDMQVDLTEKISFNCRNIIKKSRKNYFGIYDDQYDPVTKRKKIFVPLTRDMTETTVKNIDLDTKDIGVKAKNPESYEIAAMSRYLLASYLDKIRFGRLLNRIIRRTAVEGTAVLKKFNNGKDVNISIVENLNFWTDPSANYLTESASNIELNWLTETEAKSYDWDNIELISGRTSIERIEGLVKPTKIPYVPLCERWGLIPKYFVTRKDNDKDLIEGVIIVSNLNSGPIVHLIAENKTGKRPYGEFRTKMYDGRWAGMGIGEDLLDLQSYLNEIFNIRLNTSRIKQLGLFQIRKGSGITPQMLSQLYSGHGIQVSRLDYDIKELPTSDVKVSSYKDEEEAYLWSQRVTGAWQLARGESLPASMPATTAMLQEKGMNSGFGLQQEELGFNISSFIEELLLPDILKNLKDEDVVRITGDPNELKMLDDTYANNFVNEKILEFYNTKGYYPSEEEIVREKAKVTAELSKYGRDRFIDIKKKLFDPKKILDSIDVFITGEGFDKMVMARQLNDMLANYSRMPGINIDTDKIVAELLDLMGLGSERFMKKVQPQMMSQQLPQSITPQMQQQLQGRAAQLNPSQTNLMSPQATEAIGESATLERGRMM